MADLAEFTQDLAKFQAAVELAPGIAARKIALGIHRRLTHKTPVLEGRAKANWFGSIGEPSKKVDNEAVDTSPLGASSAPSPFPRAVPKFATLYITNNLPYIVPLNEGSSTQAPSNFVELAIAEELSVLQ